VQAGILQPKLVARGLFGRAPEVRLYNPVLLDRLREAHTPPADWMRMAEAAAGCGITPTGLESRSIRNAWAVVVDFAGRKWVDPAVAVTAPADVTGLLRISEVFERLGLAPTASRRSSRRPTTCSPRPTSTAHCPAHWPTSTPPPAPDPGTAPWLQRRLLGQFARGSQMAGSWHLCVMSASGSRFARRACG
jgi:hypothetical protein